jgi:hypothetical protein
LLHGVALASNSLAQSEANAGAWLQPQGEGLAIATTDFSDSTRYFDSHGKLIPIPDYQKFPLGTYIEYGLSDEFTLVAQPFFDSDKQATSPSPTRLTTGGTDIGLRAGLGNFEARAGDGACAFRDPHAARQLRRRHGSRRRFPSAAPILSVSTALIGSPILKAATVLRG